MDRANDADIVISGLSGKFPQCNNINELAENLYNQVDLIGDSGPRWPVGLYGLPARLGTLKNVDKFDATFFRLNSKRTNHMAPQIRLLLETTYEALLDAGLNPAKLRRSRTGVYIGFANVESNESLSENVEELSGYVMTGCHAAMFANQISYCFDFNGPSVNIDTACSSSLMAFHQARIALEENECDLAIVGGVNLCLKPTISLQYQKLKMLSADGKCKFLDSTANGYVRSETCSICVLQKARNAKRIYAFVVGSQTNNDGFKEMGLTYPSWQVQCKLINDLNTQLNINPNDYIYFEAHGTGTSVGDVVECRAISKALCENKRYEPLLIGSIKTNLGHTEPASGMCQLAKICISLQNSKIPASLHLLQPNNNIESLQNNHLKACIENCSIEQDLVGSSGNLIGINSMGFGGVNVNIILKSPQNYLQRDENCLEQVDAFGGIKRLVFVAGRTSESCRYIIDWICKNRSQVTADFLALLQEIYTNPQEGFNHRSYMLLDNDQDDSHNEPQLNDIDEDIVEVNGQRQPIWFVIPGMGAQWPEMGKAMMQLSMFADSIFKSAKILQEYDLDLVEIIAKPCENQQDDLMQCVLGLAAIQIALIDCLSELGIEPDGYIGHSMGETICAYIDKSLTREQVLKSYYLRVLCVLDTSQCQGKMIATNLSWQEAQNACAGYGIAPACHNGPGSVSISGPSQLVEKLMDKLNSEQKFVRPINSCGIAFHSPAIQFAAKKMLQKLQTIMPSKELLKERSNKWLSTSYSDQNCEESRYPGAEYWVNNFIAPVYFKEAFEKVPNNAIVIEVSPHSLLQSILKPSMNSADSHYISLMKRNNNANNMQLFLSALGRLYQLGHQVKIDKLYPQVRFPVELKTASISPLIKWDHSQSWLVARYPDYFNRSANADFTYKFDLTNREQEFLIDYKIDGKCLFPMTGYLMLAWRTLAKCKGHFQHELPVIFEDVQLHGTTIMSSQTTTLYSICLMEQSGKFTITESDRVIVTGKIFSSESPLKLQYLLKIQQQEYKSCNDLVILQNNDLYREFQFRGYDYGPKFRCLQEFNMASNIAQVHHNGEWTCFADSLFQTALISMDSRSILQLPVRFQSLRCDPIILAEACKQQKELQIIHDKNLGVICGKGLELSGLRFGDPAHRDANIPRESIEIMQFVPNSCSDISISVNTSDYEAACARLVCQIANRFNFSLNSLCNFDLANKIERLSHKINDDSLKNLMENQREDMKLLMGLEKILHDDGNNAQGDLIALINNRAIIEADLMANIACDEQFLRPFIDIVFENTTTKSSVKVIELNATNGLVVQHVFKYLKLNHLNDIFSPKVDYTLLQGIASEPNEKLDQNVTTKILWNFTESNDDLPCKDVHLAIYKAALDDKCCKLLGDISSSINPNGFAILMMRTKLSIIEQFGDKLIPQKIQNVDEILEFARNVGLEIICDLSDINQTTRALLMRKLPNDDINSSKQIMIQITDNIDDWQDEVRNSLASSGNDNIWLIADDPTLNVGLIDNLRLDPDGERLRYIFNQTDEKDLIERHLEAIIKRDLFANVLRFDKNASAPNNSPELLQISGSYRHLTVENKSMNMIETNEAFLGISDSGDLSTLQWISSCDDLREYKQNATKYFIYYAPLNNLDLLLATGKMFTANPMEKTSPFGLEFAGCDKSGRRVMGCVASSGHLATSVMVNETCESFVWQIPEFWSMEQASTIPIAYTTAYYALLVRGKLRIGESVLINSALSDIGQAAISICLARKCQLFCTVESLDEKQYLIKLFPLLTDDNFANRQDCSFEKYIMRQTKGIGVDVILNSLSEDDLVQASLRSLGLHGRFLQLENTDLSRDNSIGLAAFLKNITFEGISMQTLLDTNEESATKILKDKKRVAQLIQSGIESGEVKPLQTKLFHSNQVKEAFHHMADGNYIGKIVIKMRSEQRQQAQIAEVAAGHSDIRLSATAQRTFNPSVWYIITNGLSQFGLELANWLLSRNARNLLLLSKTGPRNGFQKMAIKRLERFKDVNVVIHTNKICKIDDAIELIKTIEESDGPVETKISGIFHLTMIVDEAFVECETVESVCKLAVDMTIALDDATRNLSKHTCDYFVTFSSKFSTRNNVSQNSKYRFANSIIEQCCEKRRDDGYHSLSIQCHSIGPIRPNEISSCLETLGKLLSLSHAGGNYYARLGMQSNMNDDRQLSSWCNDNVQHPDEDLTETLCRMLNVDEISQTVQLANFGMDSSTGVQIQRFLEQNHSLVLSIQDLRVLTLQDIKQLINKS